MSEPDVCRVAEEIVAQRVDEALAQMKHIARLRMEERAFDDYYRNVVESLNKSGETQIEDHVKTSYL